MTRGGERGRSRSNVRPRSNERPGADPSKAAGSPRRGAGASQRSEGAPPARVVVPLLPTIPESVGLQPLTAALLTVVAFLDLAEGEVDPAAAGRVLERVGFYAQRLTDEELDELTIDLERLGDHAREQGWPEDAREFVDNFLIYCGFSLEEEEDDADLDAADEGDEGGEGDEGDEDDEAEGGPDGRER